MIDAHFRKKAKKIIGARSTECAKWAWQLKIDLVTTALIEAFNEGRDYEKGEGLKHD